MELKRCRQRILINGCACDCTSHEASEVNGVDEADDIDTASDTPGNSFFDDGLFDGVFQGYFLDGDLFLVNYNRLIASNSAHRVGATNPGHGLQLLGDSRLGQQESRPGRLEDFEYDLLKV